MMRASCLHPRTPHWCSATVGASQVSGRQSGRPSSPPSRRDWCQGCALPGRLPSSPARHPVEPVPGVRGQAFWGESVCPMLPWRQLFPRPTVELPEGSSWARAEDGESTGMCLPSCHHHTPLGAAAEPWADLHRCPLDGYCFADPRCLGLNRNFSCKMQSPSLCPQLGSVLTEGLRASHDSPALLTLASRPPVFNVIGSSGEFQRGGRKVEEGFFECPSVCARIVRDQPSKLQGP